MEDGSYAVAMDDPVRQFLRENVTELERQAFLGSGLVLTLFGIILALNRFRHRFWCRYICPLGALLGAFRAAAAVAASRAAGDLQPV